MRKNYINLLLFKFIFVENSLISSVEPCDYSWTPSSELALFQEMISHKPAGINKRFSMAVVSDKLSSEFGRRNTYT